MMHDFSGDFHGDCFEAVRRLLKCDYNTALRQVASHFNLTENVPVIRKTVEKRVVTKRKKIIQIKRREWTLGDKDYWSQFKITRKDLKQYCVSPISVLWIDGDIKYVHTACDPAYAYYFGDGNYKIYFPLRREYRFLSNGPHVQGLNQLPKTTQHLIITKSLKDIIVLNKMGFNSIAPPAEGALIDSEVIELTKNYDRTILFDNDTPGIKWAKANSLEYQIYWCHLSIESGAKDVSDLVKLVGLEEAKQILKTRIKQRKLCHKEEE